MLERTLSTAVPNISLRSLVTAYAQATDNAILKKRLKKKGNKGLKNTFLQELKKAIRGTPRQALIIDTLTFFTSATAAVAISPAVNSMQHLNGALKNILVGSPSLTGAILTLPAGTRFDKNGGKNTILALRTIAILGMLGLTTLSAMTDLSTVDSFDSRYAGMLGLNLLVGATYPSFLCSTNIIHWYPSANIGHATSLYAGLGNLGPGLFLLLLQLAAKEISLPVSFGLSAFSLLSGTVLMAKFFVEAPYHQLRKLNFPHQQAVAMASLLNQERFPLPPDTSYLKLLGSTAYDLRAFSLSLASSSFGIFFASTISLSITLVNVLKLTPTQATLTTSAGSIWSTLVRIVSGKLIDRFDHSHGVHASTLSGMLTMLGALMMAIPKPLPHFAYAAASQGLIFTGTGIGTSAAIVTLSHWSTPQNTYSKPYNHGTMSGITGSMGTLWGIILPATTAGFVWENEKDGYQNFFYLVTCLSLVTTLMMLLTHQHLKTPLNTSLQNGWASLFRRSSPADPLENDIELGNAPPHRESSTPVSPTLSSNPHALFHPVKRPASETRHSNKSAQPVTTRNNQIVSNLPSPQQ